MLPNACKELLTAYIDGELSARQTRQVLKLLRHSAEARRLLSQLQADSRELHALDTPALGFDLSDTIVETIVRNGLKPRRHIPAPAPLSIWPGVAADRAVLLLACGGSYVYFVSALSGPSGDSSQAKNKKDDDPKKTDQHPIRIVEGPKDTDKTPNKDGTSRTDEKPDGPRTDVVRNPDKVTEPKFYGPEFDPNRANGSALTARVIEAAQFTKMTDERPTFVRLHELDQPAMRQRFLAELQKGGSFRMEVPTISGSKALESLRAALKPEQISLTINASQAAKQKAANYVLFLENVTGEELVRVFQVLGAEDRKASARRPNDALFYGLLAWRMGENDHKALLRLLGVDPTTTSRVGDPGKAAARQGLVLPHPLKPGAFASDVRRFLESRKPARPGTVQVMLVLRGV